MKRPAYQVHYTVGILLMFVLFFSTAKQSEACSVFSPRQSGAVAGNYDWQIPGGMIIANPRGLEKTAFMKDPTNTPVSWTSRFASVTMSQWGREFPMQGMNTRGLAGVVLNGPAQWASDGSMPSISEMQWLQYQLDNYSSVAEVASHLQDIRVAPLSGQLHFFLCDIEDQCGVVEFLNQQPVIYQRENLPVRAVTNSSYLMSLNVWNHFLAGSSTASDLPQTYQSLDRFVRAAWFTQDFSYSLNSAFDILTNLSGKDVTQWQSVFELKNRRLYTRVGIDGPLTELGEQAFDISCRDFPQGRSRTMSPTTGEVSPWTEYDQTFAAELLALAAKPAPGFTTRLRERMIAYPRSFRCSPPKENYHDQKNQKLPILTRDRILHNNQ